ncbi:plasmid mobilization protein [Tenacibaculum maritimum]|uniref:plasmid mobilization protein n=1 Tax=Tenacibaculum maritimum TaxID=107401 RepID=UPI0012E41404|nr:helix-turn-helix domain containing protein [Tenacibaculum maritimum]CAA0224477.1 hypothetical protein USCSE301_440014 [Tenacibaculum maritimum]
MKYSKEQRKLIAKKAIEEKNVAKTSAEYGLNQSTVYRYIEKLSNNDNRKNHLSISFTDKEYEKLVSKAKDLGYEKNYAYYIRKMLFDKDRIMVNPKVLIDELYLLRAELNKIGSNLNQVANYTNLLTKNNIVENSHTKELKDIQLNFEIKVNELKNAIDKTLEKV